MYDKTDSRDKDKTFGRLWIWGIFIRRGIPLLGETDFRVHKLGETITYYLLNTKCFSRPNGRNTGEKDFYCVIGNWPFGFYQSLTHRRRS